MNSWSSKKSTLTSRSVLPPSNEGLTCDCKIEITNVEYTGNAPNEEKPLLYEIIGGSNFCPGDPVFGPCDLFNIVANSLKDEEQDCVDIFNAGCTLHEGDVYDPFYQDGICAVPHFASFDITLLGGIAYNPSPTNPCGVLSADEEIIIDYRVICEQTRGQGQNPIIKCNDPATQPKTTLEGQFLIDADGSTSETHTIDLKKCGCDPYFG